jgi:hypothetical protein
MQNAVALQPQEPQGSAVGLLADGSWCRFKRKGVGYRLIGECDPEESRRISEIAFSGGALFSRARYNKGEFAIAHPSPSFFNKGK